jgi:ornithine--oxo-acid transaminase
MANNIADLFARCERDRFSMHARHLNEQMVRVLKAIRYDVGFCRGEGQYLYDRKGIRYLDLLSGFGVFAIGRNHPALREALKSVLDADFPNLVHMDVSPLAGILAERLLAYVPYLDKVPFLNSGSEAVEAAIKFVRAATGRPGIIYCEHAFHGLSCGALSLSGCDIFRNRFEPLLPNCVRVPFNDLVGLERALHSKSIAVRTFRASVSHRARPIRPTPAPVSICQQKVVRPRCLVERARRSRSLVISAEFPHCIIEIRRAFAESA